MLLIIYPPLIVYVVVEWSSTFFREMLDLNFACMYVPIWNTIYFQVVFKAIHLISIMGNDGTFNKPLTQILLDWELGYNVLYLLLCISGLCVHPFFFSGVFSRFFVFINARKIDQSKNLYLIKRFLRCLSTKPTQHYSSF